MKFRALLLTVITTSLVLSGCSENEHNIIKPEQIDPQADEKSQTHTEIGNLTHQIARQGLNLTNEIAIHQQEETTTKEEEKTPATDAEEITKKYQKIFKMSEKLRQLVTKDFQSEKEINEAYAKYLEQQNIFLNALKESSEKPTEPKLYEALKTAKNEFIPAHSKFVKTLNQHILY